MYNNIKDRPIGNWPRDLVQLSYAKLRRNTLEIPPLKILESLKNSFTRLVGFKAFSWFMRCLKSPHPDHNSAGENKRTHSCKHE